MLEAIKQGKGTIYKWAMIFLVAINASAFTLTQTGCGFLNAARESANATRADLDGVNERISLLLQKAAEQKELYERTMIELEKAEQAGDISKQEVLVGQLKAIYEGGVELWDEIEQQKQLQGQLQTAYDNAVDRVEAAATKEEQYGSIFGTILQTGLSLFGLGGVGGAVAGAASSRNSRREAEAYKADAEDYKAGLSATSRLLEKTKELAPENWAKVDKAAILPPAGSRVRDKIDEVRPK